MDAQTRVQVREPTILPASAAATGTSRVQVKSCSELRENFLPFSNKPAWGALRAVQLARDGAQHGILHVAHGLHDESRVWDSRSNETPRLTGSLPEYET